MGIAKSELIPDPTMPSLHSCSLMFSTSPEQATCSAKLSRYRDTFSPSTFCLELYSENIPKTNKFDVAQSRSLNRLQNKINGFNVNQLNIEQNNFFFFESNIAYRTFCFLKFRFSVLPKKSINLNFNYFYFKMQIQI